MHGKDRYENLSIQYTENFSVVKKMKISSEKS